MLRTRRKWTVAAVQMTSTADRERNLAVAERLARRAAAAGAQLIAFPENFTYLHSEGSRIPFADDPRGPLVTRLRGWARELRCWILAGSIPEKIPRRRRVHNSSLLLDPAGRIAARYRKIHLFDIDVPGRVTLQESKTIAPGNRAVVASTPLGKLGLSICYDLRFPELYRRLTRLGAQVLFIPSAFTAYTGRFHWMPLIRARAIENQCWVVAPAQWGKHCARRASHGETMILDPWGEIVARKKDGVGVVTAEIDLSMVETIRRDLPSQPHPRNF